MRKKTIKQSHRDRLAKMANRARRKRKFQNWLDQAQEIMFIPMVIALLWLYAAMFGK